MAEVPEGFEVVADVPEGFEVVDTVSPEGNIIDAVVEPIRAIGSGLANTAQGGLEGIVTAATDGLPQAVEGIEQRQSEAFTPQTEAGKKGLSVVGDLAQTGLDIANFPLSGIGGIIELVSGQGIDQATQTIKAIQDQGVSKVLGERVFEETGSPLAATAAQILPEAALEVAGLGAARRAGATPSTGRVVQRGKELTGEVIEAAKKAPQEAKKIFQYQTPTRRKIAQRIADGSTDIDTAKFKLTADSTAQSPRAVFDKTADAALKQGFDEGIVAMVKGAEKTDQPKFKRMVDIMERGKKNARFAANNRPSDVLGDSVMTRINIIQRANKAAGRRIDAVAKDLKGQQIDIAPVRESFGNSLDEMGIAIKRSDDGELIVNFKGSDIEGLAGPEGVVTRLIKRLDGTNINDAFEAHRLKRFIDEQVTYGKNAEGLAGKTERVLKQLRTDIDGQLDANFPEYDRINTAYSDTVGALDSLQDVAGRKLDLTGDKASKATGQLMRRTLSNANSRINLLDAIDEIEKVSRQYERFRPDLDPRLIEGPFESVLKDDLLNQTLFVDELDRVFGTPARTSFQGQIQQGIEQAGRAVTQGPESLILQKGGEALEKARGINPENAFKIMRKLLSEQSQ